MKNPKRKKRTSTTPYTPDRPTDPFVEMRDNAHTQNFCLGQRYLDATRRLALEESKATIERNTITPKKPNWKLWNTKEKK